VDIDGPKEYQKYQPPAFQMAAVSKDAIPEFRKTDGIKVRQQCAQGQARSEQ
jgi:hypothetical protein